jgi:hypothetical protein
LGPSRQVEVSARLSHTASAAFARLIKASIERAGAEGGSSG